MDRLSTRLESPLAKRQLESVLEEICAALVALEVVSDREAALKRSPGFDPRLGRAIEYLRMATSELRVAHDDADACFTPGFVLQRAKP